MAGRDDNRVAAVRDESEAVRRHIAESLFLAAQLPQGTVTVCDLGSGGGSPAIPIQLYRPAETLILVESKERKAAFLRGLRRTSNIACFKASFGFSCSKRARAVADSVTATTTYPFKLYNVNGNTIYKHIFANGEPVADVQGSTTTAVPRRMRSVRAAR